MYIVVEVCDRELTSIKSVPDEQSAIDHANALLKHHCEIIGEADTYEEYMKNPDSREFAEEIKMAGRDIGTDNAWCNLNGTHWDAFFYSAHIDPETGLVESDHY